MKRSILLFALVIPLVWIGASSEIADEVAINEWTVPWENTRPRDPYVDNQDRVWFVGQRGNYLAYLTPSNGEFKRYDLPEGTGPHNLIVDDQGTVWFAGNRDAYIGRLNPETGDVKRYPMPNPEARDPHTLVFDPADNIWFTVQGGNFVGHFNLETEAINLIEVPTPRARPYGIVTTETGRPWIAELGTNKLGTVDPETMEYKEVALPREDANPRRLDLTSDGMIWYVDYTQGYLGRYNPESGEFQEWRVPGGGQARPYGMTADDTDRLWFVETGRQPNRLVGFNPETKEFFGMTEIPSGGGTVRNMYFKPEDRTIWFGTDTNTIARVQVP